MSLVLEEPSRLHDAWRYNIACLFHTIARIYSFFYLLWTCVTLLVHNLMGYEYYVLILVALMHIFHINHNPVYLLK